MQEAWAQFGQMKVVLEQLRSPVEILEGGWSSHVGMKCRIMQQQHLIGFEGKFQTSEPMGRAAVLYLYSMYPYCQCAYGQTPSAY